MGRRELDAGLTVQEVARRDRVTGQTVTCWIREERISNAYRVHVGRGTRRIAERDLSNFQPGQRERRPGESPT